MPESSPIRPATAHVTSQAQGIDLEKHQIPPAFEKLDIEHAIVQDDPRNWSHHRKVFILTSASDIGLLLIDHYV
jgi:hypothetical protein